MPISTSTGRAAKEIVNDPGYPRAKGKSGFCHIVDKILVRTGNALAIEIGKQAWQNVYTSFTKLRRLIEIYDEVCKGAP